MLATAAEDATAAPATAAARALRTAMERRSSVAPAVVALAEPLLALARAAAARPAQPPLGGIEASAALLLAAAVDVDARSLVQAEADRAGAGVTPGAHAPKAGEAPADASPPTARAVAPGTPGGPPLAAAEAETFSAATGSGSGSSAGAAAAASSGAGSSSAADSSSSSSSSTATSTKAKSSKSGGKKKPKASAAELAMLGIGLDMPTKKKSSKKASKTSTPKASGSSSSSSSSSAAAAGAGSSGASADAGAGAGAGASAAASVNLFAAVTDPASFLYARSVHMAAGRALGTVAPLVPALQAAAAAIAVGVTAHAARCRALPQLAGIMADLRGESAGNPELDGWAEEAYHVSAAAQEASAAQEAAAAATTGSGAGAARGSSKAAAASGRRPEKPQHTGANPRPILALCHPPSAADAVRGISATEAGASSAASTAAAAAGSRVKPTRPSAAASALAAMLVHAHPGVRRATAAACRAMVVGSGPMGAGDGSAAAASGTPSQRAAVLIHALWRMVRRWAADDHAATGVSGTAIGPRKGAFAGSDAAAVLAIGPGAHREDSSGWECGVGVSGGDSADDATLALLTPAAGRGASSRVFRARPRPQWVRAAIRGILADSSGAVAVADESDRWAPADAAAIFASLVVMAHNPYVSGSDPAAARRLLADAAAALLAACGASEAPLDAAGRRSAGLGAIAAAPCADPASDAAALAAPALFALRLADPASAAAAADSGAWAAVDVLAGRPDTAAALVRLLAGRSGLLSYVPSLRIGARSALATLVAGLPAPTAASSAAATWRRDGAVGRALAAAAIVPWARGVAARACRAPLTPADVAAWSNSADHAAALAAEADTLAAADAAGDDSARRPLPLWDEAWRRSWARREEAWRLVEAGVAVPRVQDGPAAAAAADAATAAGVVSLLEWDDADDADRLLCFGRTGSAAADWVGGAGTIADGTGMLRAAASLAQDGKEAASAPREASAAEAESAIRSGALVVRGPEHGGIPAGAFAEGARAALEGRRVLRTARRLDLRSFRAVAALEALRACFDAPHAAASHGPGRQSAAACAASLAPLVADELSLALSSPLANAPARATIEAAVRAACGASAETARLGASVAHDWAAAMAAVASMEVAAEAAARPVIVVGFGGGSALGAGAAAAASSAASLRSGMASGAGGSSGFGGGLGLAMGGGGASAKAAKAAKAAKDAAKDAAATATASRANGPLRVSGLPIRVRSAPGVNSANGRAITMSGARGRLLSKRAGLFRRLLGGLCHSLGLTVAQHGRTAPGAAAAGADSAIAVRPPPMAGSGGYSLVHPGAKGDIARLPAAAAALLAPLLRAACCSFPPPAFMPAALALLAQHAAPDVADAAAAGLLDRSARAAASTVPIGPGLAGRVPVPGVGASASDSHLRAAADAWAAVAAGASAPRAAANAAAAAAASAAVPSATPAAAPVPPSADASSGAAAAPAPIPDALAPLSPPAASAAAAAAAAPGATRLLALRLARPVLLDAALSLVRVAPRATPSPVAVVRTLVAPPKGGASAVATASQLIQADARGLRAAAAASAEGGDAAAAAAAAAAAIAADDDGEPVDGGVETSVASWAASCVSPAATASLADAWVLVTDAGALSLTPDVRWAALRGLRAAAAGLAGAADAASAAGTDTGAGLAHPVTLALASTAGVGGGEAGGVLLPPALVAAAGTSVATPAAVRRAASWLPAAQAARRAADARLWLAAHDDDEDGLGAAGDAVCEEAGVEPSPALAAALMPFLGHPAVSARAAAARGLASVCEEAEDADLTAALLRAVLALHRRCGGDTGLLGNHSGVAQAAFPTEAAARAAAEADEDEAKAAKSGSGIGSAARWMARDGCMRALRELAVSGAFPVPFIVSTLAHVISRGLSDRVEAVRVSAMAAGEGLVETYGAANTAPMLATVEEALDAGPDGRLSAGTEERRNWQRGGCVVLLGALARHLAPTDRRVSGTVTTLLDTLRTPSEAVQRAVARCLPPLAKVLKSESGRIVSGLLESVIRGDSSAVRRGAAFGLAGCVKGFGLATLKAHDVMSVIEASAADKHHATARQGSMFAVERLCVSLGMLFEPYVIRILPALLKCYGDQEKDVRLAAAGASRAVMRKLSAHGVKLVMPSLLEGLGATQWRTKQASIRMLGATAFCAPKQLGACLPQVVPQLLNAHSDTHPKVRAAALTALNNVGGVVRNPEVSAISSELLAALTDPIGKTSAALDILASTSFVHAVDPPSLALLMPVLRRGLVATSAEVKQTACAIAGSMTSLVGDPAHLAPYLPELLPLLKTTVVDPIPDVRAVAARALGATVKGVGEDAVGGLLDWLKASTASTGSAVERSGGAQGLCEVAAAIGDDCVDETIEQMLARAKDPSPEARQGLFWFLAFLPPVLGDDFGPLLRRVFSVIVQGLADDMEVVRDIALRAGKVVVRMHGLSSTDVILPTLESGLMHTSWRVRQCAIKLVMDLVHRAAGDEGTSTDAHGNTLVGAHDDDDDAAARDDDEDEDDRWFEEKPEAAPAADDEEAAEAAGAAADAERRRRRKARRGGRGDEEDPAAAAAARVAEAPSKATMGAKSSRIVAALGRERRDAVLSAVYLLRSDGTAAVRQAAFPAWKSASLYMPGLLHDVLPSLVDRLVAGLASDDYDVRTLAVQGLGELTRRMGETIVAEVVPVLRAGLSPDRTVDHREGVCLGLAEMLGGIHRRQLDGQMAVVSPAVRDALCDESDRVRAAAGRTFAAFQRVVGQRAVDEVVQPLLRDLDSGDDARSHRAMLGLRGVLATRGEEILPILLPKLLRAPMSVFQVRTLAAVAEVTSDVIHVHAAAIIPPLVRCLACEEAPAAAGTKAANLLAKWAGPEGPPLGVVLGGAKTGAQLPTDEANGDVYLASSMEEVLERQSGGHAEAAARFLCAIPGEALGFAVEPILGFMCGSRSPYRRMAACTLIRMLLEQTDEDASEMASSIIRDTAYRLDDPHPEVIQAAAHTLAAVVTFCDRERLLDDLRFLRDSLKSALSEGRMRRGLLGGSSGSGAAAAASSGAAAAAASTAAVAAAPKGPLRLPGLCLPTAVLPLFDFYSWAVLKGPAESKQQAAEAIGELVDMAGDEVLTPHLKKMAGPLLRVLSDAYSVNVRVAMVETLAIIVERSPRDVKVLIVTLQSSLTRQLLATEAKLREVAAEHMSLLGRHLAKVDVICKEIQKRAAAATGAIRESCLRALAFLAGAAAHRVSPPIVSLAVEVLHESLEDDDALFRAHAARALGAFLVSMEPEEAGSLVDEVVAAAEASSDSAGDWRDARTRVRALTAFLALGSASQAVIDRASSAILALGKAAKHPQAEVRSDAAHCISYALISGSASAIVEAAAARTAGVGGGLGDDESFRSQATAAATAFSGPAAVAAAAMLRRLGEDKDRDVRLEAALALRRLARRAPAVVRSHLAVLGPVVAALANDSAVQVKRAAEPAAVMVFRPQRDGTAVVASLGQAFVSTYGESIRKIGLRVSAGSSKDDTDGF
ncbi:hypothetical protein FNF27_02976 [Cafeteria roenbergensis]|uniref:TOG domain-containing protein n=1 Tax=Cafeteria roenbergensis TaxID=33653 RepID=A0A5A8ECI2_CAFRO|nr:hypothetical protein FNF27_02976 [Cafeteria roenbergensis]